MRYGNLRESDIACNARRREFVVYIAVAVQKTIAQDRKPSAKARFATEPRVPHFQAQQRFTMGPDALERLDDPLIQHFRKHDVAVKQARARLRGNPERVTKAPA